MVGAIGFEPTTSWSQTRRSTRLSYTPKESKAWAKWAYVNAAVHFPSKISTFSTVFGFPGKTYAIT